jgi:hypothetical protein
VAVWNDVRDADHCPAVDAYRAALYTNPAATRPAVATQCTGTSARFGNSDIRSAALADPTP